MKKVLIVLVICILILMIFKLNGENDNLNLSGSSGDVSIDFFAIKTYSGFNLSKKYDLSQNTIFIQTQTYGSGSVSVDFKGVSIDKEVKFNVSINSPEIGTMEMAYWYLVAVVPNTNLPLLDSQVIILKIFFSCLSTCFCLDFLVIFLKTFFRCFSTRLSCFSIANS